MTNELLVLILKTECFEELTENLNIITKLEWLIVNQYDTCAVLYE